MSSYEEIVDDLEYDIEPIIESPDEKTTSTDNSKNKDSINTNKVREISTSKTKYVTMSVNDEVIYPRTSARNIDDILPLNNGGTGIDKVTGGKLIASSVSGLMLEEIDVPVNYFNGLDTNIKNKFDSIDESIKTINSSDSVPGKIYDIHVENWVQGSTFNSYELEYVGLNGDVVYVMPLIMPKSDESERNANMDAYSHINAVITDDNSIALLSYNGIPEKNFSIVVMRLSA